MKFSFIVASLLLFVGMPAAIAKDDTFYGILAAGYAANDMDEASLDAFSYKVGVGYELGAQWNVEVGFQMLGEKRLEMNELTLDNGSQEISAVTLSALGKARNRHGELFYRIGIMRADVSKDYLDMGDACAGTSNTLSQNNNLVLCQSSDSKIAGIVGLGFDFYIHHSTMLRLEVEHIQGQDGLSANAAYIGFRLNF
jgi:opacity protein-like surface antigen